MKQRWTLQMAERHLEAHGASGLTKKGYFNSQGIKAAIFYYWQQKSRESQATSSGFTELKMAVTKEHNNLSKGPIGTALYYASHHLSKLSAYLDDGCILIDNNLIENAVRPLAIGRKNYLFAGSHQGAKRAAMMYSFFASCKTLDVNPWQWLKFVLENIGTLPINKIESLLPQNWTKVNQEG